MSENDQTSYGLEPVPEAPELPGTVRMGEDEEEALDMLAADLFMHSSSCVSSFGHFHLALAHDRSTERVIMKLMTDPKYRSIPWDRTHIWSVCERVLEPGHPEHSMPHWRELAAEPGELPENQLHAIEGHLHDAPGLYERRLIEHLEWRERGHDRLDYVILGAQPGLLRGVDDPMDRLVGMSEDDAWISMTRRLLNASRAIAVVGLGRDGRGLVDAIRDDHDRIGLSPEIGALRWYLDAYACRCTDEEPL